MAIGLNRRGMQMRVLLLVMMLSGCATTYNVYGGAFGQNVAGNAVSVSVSNVWNQQDAMPLADEHCAKFNKAARFISFADNTASFDCVTP